MSNTTTIHPIHIKYFWVKMLIVTILVFLFAICIGSFFEGTSFVEALESSIEMIYLMGIGYLAAFICCKIFFTDESI